MPQNLFFFPSKIGCATYKKQTANSPSSVASSTCCCSSTFQWKQSSSSSFSSHAQSTAGSPCYTAVAMSFSSTFTLTLRQSQFFSPLCVCQGLHDKIVATKLQFAFFRHFVEKQLKTKHEKVQSAVRKTLLPNINLAAFTFHASRTNY